jgi:hypothetical protein
MDLEEWIAWPLIWLVAISFVLDVIAYAAGLGAAVEAFL